MIDLEKALSIINKNISSLGGEVIKSTEACNRVLFAEVKANISNPSYDSSAMDGIAIKYSEYIKKKDHIYKIAGEVFAGKEKKYILKKNQAVKIYTGGKLPSDTDTVVIQENIKYVEKNYVRIKGKIVKNQFVRKKGLDFKANTIILKKNKKLNPTDIALLISAGVKEIQVYKKASVAFFSSGDELVSPKHDLKTGQVYASSMFMIKELIINSGCSIKNFKILKDNKTTIVNNLKNLKKVDLIITTGGVSVGKKDLIKHALNELNFRIKFWKVSVMPGKPLLFGTLKKIPLFGLPGNPVSSYVCFMLFVLSAINKLNCNEIIKIKTKCLNLKNDFYHSSDRTAYLRGKIITTKNLEFVEVFKKQDSSMLKSLADSNCLIKIKPCSKLFKKNTKLEIIFFA